MNLCMVVNIDSVSLASLCAININIIHQYVSLVKILVNINEQVHSFWASGTSAQKERIGKNGTSQK